MEGKHLTPDKELFNPPIDVLSFYSMYGEDYTEWYSQADELMQIVDNIFHSFTGYAGKTVLDKVFDELVPASVSPFNIYFINKNLKQYNLDAYDMFSVNSNGLRCDEFKTSHDGAHILFAGCSITFGDGMFEEYAWAKKTYDKIASTTPTSGYYNVAVPGFNHAQIYSQIFKYISKYGNPDYLFINWPDLRRLVDFGISKEALTATVHAMQLSLELYCKSNNIKLIAFSWDTRCCTDHSEDDENPNDILYMFNADPRDRFEYGFYRWHSEDRMKHMMQFEIDNKNHKYEKFFMRAFDVVHPGIAEHDFYADFAYKTWKDIHGSV
ncbi:MAG: hypothetical protein WAO41_08770 [Candidatus Nanopelagicales bacterium]